MSAKKEARIIRTLRRLARRGAYLERSGDAGAASVIVAADGAERIEVADAIVAHADQRGWLAALDHDSHADTDAAAARRYVLSRRGRAILRGGSSAVARGYNCSVTSDATFDAESVGLSGRDSPLAWLRARRGRNGAPMISEADFRAGLKLRVDYLRATETARTTVTYAEREPETCSGTELGNAAAERIDRALSAQDAIRTALDRLGPELSGIVVDVCCHDRGLSQVEKARALPPRSAKHFLQIGLGQLARHYGYATHAPERPNDFGAGS